MDARTPELQRNEILLSESLARELDTHAADSIVLRVEKPSAIPIESLHSRKEDLGITLRLTVKEALGAGCAWRVFFATSAGCGARRFRAAEHVAKGIGATRQSQSCFG